MIVMLCNVLFEGKANEDWQKELFVDVMLFISRCFGQKKEQ